MLHGGQLTLSAKVGGVDTDEAKAVPVPPFPQVGWVDASQEAGLAQKIGKPLARCTNFGLRCSKIITLYVIRNTR
jgi:hypothetical protein